MKNILDINEFYNNFGVFSTNIKLNESTELFNSEMEKIIRVNNQKILVINDIKFAETLKSHNEIVWCIYFDNKVKLPESSNVVYKFVNLMRRGTDINQSTKDAIDDIFNESNIEFDFVFNFSPDTFSPLTYEVVSNLNLYIFKKVFVHGITAYYSFDELDVMDNFDALLYKDMKIKSHAKKKFNFKKWSSEYGFDCKTETDRYLSVVFVQDNEVFHTHEDLDETDFGTTGDFGDDRGLLKGVIEPRIYVFRSDLIDNIVGEDTIKVGDTDRGVAVRMEEWKKVYPDLELLGDFPAIITGCGEGIDGKVFRDKVLHKFLNKKHIEKDEWKSDMYYSNELFKCDKNDAITVVEQAIEELKNAATEGRADVVTKLKDNNKNNKTSFIFPTHNKPLPYSPRDIQQKVIDNFIDRYVSGVKNMLIYAVMRFGKTFVACECVKEYCGEAGKSKGGKFIMVVSAKVDVKNEWIGSINPYNNYSNIDMYSASFNDGDGCLFNMLQNDKEWLDAEKTVSGPHPGKKYDTIDEYFKDYPDKNIMLFASLQDLKGSLDTETSEEVNENGEIIKLTTQQIKTRHKCFYDYPIDMLIIDEAHFGSQSNKLSEQTDEGIKKGKRRKKIIGVDENGDEIYLEKLNIKGEDNPDPTIKLHLSGTPYKLVQTGKFDKPEIIASFGFADLMKAKQDWINENKEKIEKNEIDLSDNPYFGIPEMIQFGYNFEDFNFKDIDGKYDFKTLFTIVGNKNKKVFKYEKDILRLFSAIDGSEIEEDGEYTKNSNVLSLLDLPEIKKGNMCKHIVMVLPSKDSCDVMFNFIRKYKKTLKNLGTYKIINVAGYTTNLDTETAKKFIQDEVNYGNKTITLTVDKMLTGVTVKPWDTMFYMKDGKAPQGYDQARFRIQSPYIKKLEEIEFGDDLKTVSIAETTTKVDMKPQTIFVDFSANRIFELLYERYTSDIIAEGKDIEETSAEIKKRLEREYECMPIVINENGKLKRVESTNIMDKIAEASAKNLFSKTVNQMISTFEWPDPSDDDVDNLKGFSMSYNSIGRTGISGSMNNADESEKIEDESKKALKATYDDDGSVEGKKKVSRRATMTEEIIEENKCFQTQCDTILMNIAIYLVVRKDNKKILDFHDLFSDSMRPYDTDINLETIINVFGDGIVPDDIEKQRQKATKIVNKLQRWVNYLKHGKDRLKYKVERYIIAISNKYGADRKDYKKIRNTIEEFGAGKLGKSEIITPDNLSKKLLENIVIFNNNKILDCYGSKTGEIAYYMYDNYPDFSLDNYYLIVKNPMLKEISKVTLGIIYDMTKKGKNKKKHEFLNDHILVFDYENKIEKDETDEVLEGRKPKFGKVTKELEKTKVLGLENAIKNKWGNDMKFDIVVGNPPYGRKIKGMSSTLHLQIMNTILDFCKDKLCFIMPSAPIKKQLPKNSVWYKMFTNAVCTKIETINKTFFPSTNQDDVAIYYCDRNTNQDDYDRQLDVDDKIYYILPDVGKLFIDKMSKMNQLVSFMICGTKSKELDRIDFEKKSHKDCFYFNVNGACGTFGGKWISGTLATEGIYTRDEQISFNKRYDKSKRNIMECPNGDYGKNLKSLMIDGKVLRYGLWLMQTNQNIYQDQFKYVPDIDYTNIHNDIELLTACGFTEEETKKVLDYLETFDFSQNRNDIVRDYTGEYVDVSEEYETDNNEQESSKNHFSTMNDEQLKKIFVNKYKKYINSYSNYSFKEWLEIYTDVFDE